MYDGINCESFCLELLEGSRYVYSVISHHDYVGGDTKKSPANRCSTSFKRSCKASTSVSQDLTDTDAGAKAVSPLFGTELMAGCISTVSISSLLGRPGWDAIISPGCVKVSFPVGSGVGSDETAAPTSVPSCALGGSIEF